MVSMDEALNILGLVSPPPFSDLMLLNWKEKWKTVGDFVIESSTVEGTTININKVSGTSHPSYAGQTWTYLLTSSQRINQRLEDFKRNPNYYLRTLPSDDIVSYHLIVGEEDLYIDTGNHRSCIAKFYLHKLGINDLHGVQVRNYTIDTKFMAAFNSLKTMIKKVNPHLQITVINTTKESAKTDTGFRTINSLSARVAGGGEVKILNIEEMYQYIDMLKNHRKPKWFNWLFVKNC